MNDDLLKGVTPQNILEGMSKKNLKHSIKHLSEFQKLDSGITEDSLRQLGASIVKPENFISNLDSSQKAFQQIVKIGSKSILLRVVLNEKNKLHSIHIRSK